MTSRASTWLSSSAKGSNKGRKQTVTLFLCVKIQFSTSSVIPEDLRKKGIILSKGRTIRIAIHSLQPIIPNNQIKSIVPYGNLQGNTLGLRLSQTNLNNMFLTQIQIEKIIGLMLGDLHIKKMSRNGAPMIQFNQGFVHLPYILFLFQFLAPICTHYPSLIQRKDGTFYLQFYSRCLAALTPIYDLFWRLLRV